MQIKMLKAKRVIFFVATLAYAIGLFFFYIKYVPLVKPFQYILIPVILLALVSTTISVQWGTLFFVFSFPLINNLPYFFGIFEPIPHAPTALVLCLFYLLGWLLHMIFFKPQPSLRSHLFKPVLLSSILIFLSAILTIFRYVNFFPFRSDRVYELVTNTIGVTAGGAVMSIIFSSLSYLTGFAFFFILLSSLSSKKYMMKILYLLSISTFLSLALALVQHLLDQEIGNNPISIHQGLINGTFKDALSLGAYLSACIPLLGALAFSISGQKRAFFLLTFLLAIYIFPHTGSRIGFATTSVFLILFILILAKLEWQNVKGQSGKKLSFIFVGFFVCILSCSLVFLSFRKSIVSQRFTTPRMLEYATQQRWNYLWKIALRMIKDTPLSGVGVGAYIIELPNSPEFNKSYLKTIDSSENYFLQIGAEQGIIGLFLSLWIFWEIFKRIRKNMRIPPSSARWKYIQIGILLGIVALFVAFLFHTYIGSFEIIYTFWLWIALILSMSNRLEEIAPTERSLGRKGSPLIWLAIFVFFAVAILWSSTHSLSLEARTETLNLKQDFSLDKLEKTSDGLEFRWTKGYGGVSINVEKPIIRIPLLASHPDLDKNPLRINLFLIKNLFRQKKLLGEIVLKSPEWETFEYDLSAELNEKLILLIKVSRTWNPQKARGTRDARNLGVALGKIEFKESPFSILRVACDYVYDGTDFDGDGSADISVWRPSNGYWFIRNAAIKQWGASGDIPVPGDYDGDRKTDIAIWRPSIGYWHIQYSSGGIGIIPWGMEDDIPVPGDYDGDGRTDIVVWRPSNGQWFIRYSGGGVEVIPWGVAGDKPVPGDYDGDQRKEIAVWRPSNGCWFIRYSGGKLEVVPWGASRDIPVPQDYDGDKKTDIAVWRPSHGQWFIRKSTGRIEVATWGTEGDIPTPGDYNGRGKTEVAVFRPANGLWFIKDVMIVPWGISGDAPLVR